MTTLDEIKKQLDEIYEQIPSFDCKRCGKCCGPIVWFKPEDLVIQEFMKQHGIEHVIWSMDDYEKNGFHCPYWNEKKGCLIYPVRPFICRMQGLSNDLPCANREADFPPRRHIDILWRTYKKLNDKIGGEFGKK